jgi:hypothetical protein
VELKATDERWQGHGVTPVWDTRAIVPEAQQVHWRSTIDLILFAFSAVLPAVLHIATLLIVFAQPLPCGRVIGLMYTSQLLLCFSETSAAWLYSA